MKLCGLFIESSRAGKSHTRRPHGTANPAIPRPRATALDWKRIAKMAATWDAVIFTDSGEFLEDLKEHGLTGRPIPTPSIDLPFAPRGSLEALDALLADHEAPDEAIALVDLGASTVDAAVLKLAQEQLAAGDNALLASAVPFRDNPVQLLRHYNVLDLGHIPKRDPESPGGPVTLDQERSSPTETVLRIGSAFARAYRDCTLRVYAIQPHGMDIVLELPVAEAQGTPLTVEHDALLVYAIMENVLHGPFNMTEGYPPLETLWRYDMRIFYSPKAMDAKTNRFISGRQMFPNVYTTDGSFCLIRNGEADTQALISDRPDIGLFLLAESPHE